MASHFSARSASAAILSFVVACNEAKMTAKHLERRRTETQAATADAEPADARSPTDESTPATDTNADGTAKAADHSTVVPTTGDPQPERPAAPNTDSETDSPSHDDTITLTASNTLTDTGTQVPPDDTATVTESDTSTDTGTQVPGDDTTTLTDSDTATDTGTRVAADRPSCTLSISPSNPTEGETVRIEAVIEGSASTVSIDGVPVTTTAPSLEQTATTTRLIVATVENESGSNRCSAWLTTGPSAAHLGCELTASQSATDGHTTVRLTMTTQGEQIVDAALDGTALSAAGGSLDVLPTSPSHYIGRVRNSNGYEGACVIAVDVVDASVCAPHLPDSGVEAELIHNAADLAAADRGYFALASDIELPPDWQPIAGRSNLVLDGRNHTISGLRLTTADSGAGLYSQLLGGAIANLRLSDIEINAPNAADVGALAGSIHGTTICRVKTDSSSITGGASVGGLVGSGYGQLLHNHVASSVTGSSNVGGLLGTVTNAAIRKSSFAGTINAVPSSFNTDGIGGLVGAAQVPSTLPNCPEQLLIEESFATGEVKATITTANYYVPRSLGGLVGSTFAGRNFLDCTQEATLIHQSFFLGRVGQITSQPAEYDGRIYLDAGGLVGQGDGLSIARSFAVGDFGDPRTEGDVGGLVGGTSITSDNRIELSFASGTVTGLARVGGLVGSAPKLSQLSESYAAMRIGVRDMLVGTRSTAFGGLIGGVGHPSSWPIAITDSAAIGEIDTTHYSDIDAGGIVGHSVGEAVTVTHSFAGMQIHRLPQYLSVRVGGLTGFGRPTFDSCYWDIDRAGVTTAVGDHDLPWIEADPAGTFGLTSAQAASTASFANWNFDA